MPDDALEVSESGKLTGVVHSGIYGKEREDSSEMQASLSPVE